MAATAIKDLTTVSAAHGEMSYNGVEFNVFRKFMLDGEDVWDDAGRAITQIRYKLTVGTTIFAADQAASATSVASLRRLLSEPGRQLKITGIGLGDIIVGGAGATHQEVDWGPKPKLLSIKEAHGLQAFEIVWTCEFCISECGTEAGFPSWLVFNYTASYRNDHRGLCERNIAGYVKIPQSRDAAGSGIVAHTADEVWDSITIAVPVGFFRADGTRQLSADGNRLDFSVTDRQLEGSALPAGIVPGSEADYELANAGAMNFERWNGRLTANFEVAPGLNKSVAAQAFYLLMLNKLAELNTAIMENNPEGTVVIERIMARSSLFSQRTSFAAGFYAVGCLDSVLGAGGLWTPVEGTNYQQWATSMANLWANRGTAGLRHLAAQDAIIDVCTPTVSASIGGDGTSLTETGGDFSGVLDPQIPPDGGWLAYSNRLVSVREQSASVHSLMEQYEPYESPSPSEGVVFAQVNSTKPEIQYNGGPIDQILMVGKAMRVKHKPTVPKLVSVGGVPVREIEAKVDGPLIRTCFLGLPVYIVRWAILYQVDGYLVTVPPQQRKVGCCDEGV